MCKRSIYLVSLCLVLGLASVAPAKLVAHWKLDDGSGLTASDSSGNGFDGTLIGGPTWIVGTDGGALEFDGRDDYVNFSNSTGWPAGKSPRTLCGWGRTNTVASGWRWIASYGSEGTGLATFIGLNGSTLYVGGYGDDIGVNNAWQVGEWFHVAVTYDGTTAKAYLNGREVGSMAKNWNTTLSLARIGQQVNSYNEFWNGAVDDVRLYDQALKAAEVKALVPPKVKARNPSPANGASGVTMGLFTWISGETAVFENVYFGTTPDLTDADRVLTRQPALYKLYYRQEPLVPGQRYYWRVDAIESNGTIQTGDVWTFFVTPQTAWAPKPGNGVTYVDPNVTLEWSVGLNATSHDVYFGTDRAAVEAGTGDTRKATSQYTASYAPGLLARGATYYWRVDETAASKVKGETWSFTVRPLIAKVDPNLVGWWKLDDENSGTAVDYSGWDIYGELRGDPQWVEGCYGDALQFDGSDDYVDFGNPQGWASGASPRSMCGWAKTDTVAVGWRWIAAYGSAGTGLAMFIGMTGTDLYGGGYGDDVFKAGFWEPDVWHHICLTYDGTTARLYADGVEVASAPKSWNLTLGRAHIGRQVNDLVEFWDGAVDDVRVYNKALTPEEVRQAMRGDPLLAWNPQPKAGANVDIRDAATLSWSPGETAAQHDVYLGTDQTAVKTATASSPEYKGRQTDASFASAGLVAFGGGSYFWRIDEVEADGTTVHKGSVWGFTVPDYLIVDEFEEYTNNSPNRVFQTWIDGWGFSADDFFPAGSTGNGTGALVGYDPTLGDIMETRIVHGGKQSMPVEYNNVNPPYYSEIERTWDSPQNWMLNGVTDLSLWFRGDPIPFVDDGSMITMRAESTDIWNNADQCRFACKRLSGDGSMVVKVNSLQMTGGWAKAGVMIRESLAAESTHAAMVVTPSNGVSFPWRAFTGDASNQVNQTGVQAPYWVKITRTGNTFKAEHSPDGKTWSIIGTDATLSQHDIAMSVNVYIGLCLSSYNSSAITTAEFSDIKTTGNVTGDWQVAEIGPDEPGNDPATLYVALEDSNGKRALVNHPDASATVISDWTQWQIPLSQFTSVNTKAIKKMYIGVGDRKAPTADGSGKLYIDDIHVIKP